jgi:hypothetical protein
MKLHQKGFLLVELSQHSSLWDDHLIRKAMKEYALSGQYWENNLRVALDELAAAGLITRLEEKLESFGDDDVLMFRYALSDFGRTRMVDTGLL